MSFRAIKGAFASIRERKMSAPARLVLLALANRHNQETGRCDPAIACICADVQLSERSVRSALRELEKLRIIQTVHRTIRTGAGRRNLSNRYRLKGGAQFAGGMGHSLPGNLELSTPSAFDDLAAIIDDGDDHA